jgi:hypothetical protein
MPMVESFAPFFDATEFGTEVQIGSADVLGLLERGYHEVAGIATTDPTFVCAAADADGVVEGTTQLVDGADTYVIRNVEPDGTGLAVLRLEVSA